jgi:DNA-binding transcriptional MerR regulator
LPQHVLRFWETRFSQIKPLKRGGNRRYYRPDDVELLRAIRRLLYDQGLTIKGVQKMLREQGTAAIRYESADEPATEAPVPSYEAPDMAELRRALDDLREAERLLESARPR